MGFVDPLPVFFQVVMPVAVPILYGPSCLNLPQHLLVFIFSAPTQGKTVFLNQGYGLVGGDDPRQIVEIEYEKTSSREILVNSLKRPAQVLAVYYIIETVLETDRQV